MAFQASTLEKLERMGALFIGSETAILTCVAAARVADVHPANAMSRVA